jgi:hypothetical protein
MSRSIQFWRIGRVGSFALAFFTLLAFAGIGSDITKAQDSFDDPEGKYTLKLPTGWVAIVNQDRLTGKTDFLIVHGIRENGALKISTMEVDAKAEMPDVAAKHERESLRFLSGYTKGRIENFVVGVGQRNGALISYDFKNTAGQPQVGRTYLLRVNDTTVYVLRFTGRSTALGSLRNQTDMIARSFRLK